MGKGEIWPPPPKNPSTDGHQNLQRWLCRWYLPKCKISSKSVWGFRFCACVISRPSAQSDSAIFWVLYKGYRRDAHTDFDTKYVKRRGSAQESAFWGSRNQYLRFGPPFSPKPPFLGPISTGLGIFLPENGFNSGRLESKRALIVVGAQ